MSKAFSAKKWFVDSSTFNVDDFCIPPALPTTNHQGQSKHNTLDDSGNKEEQAPFLPQSFLVPGWKGEGLFSKQALKIKKLQKVLIADAVVKFKDLHLAGRILQTQIFNEFLHYANTRSINSIEIDSVQLFWKEVVDLYQSHSFDHFLKNDKSDKDNNSRKILNEFIGHYSFKVATIYIYKLRFLSILSKKQDIQITPNSLLNPSSFFSTLFVKSSSTELDSKALKTNQYSWYRPSNDIKQNLQDTIDDFLKISINEMMKLSTCSEETNRIMAYSTIRDQIFTQKDFLDFPDNEYSHTLSHRSFGDFLKTLLTDFPNWFTNSVNKKCEILKCRFSGDYLNSFILSYWLTLESSKTADPNFILYPVFDESEFIKNSFVTTCHEIQFLSYLAEKASASNCQPVQYICEIMKQVASSKNQDAYGQYSMFLNNSDGPENLETKDFNRIIAALVKLPKKNPHHYMVSYLQRNLKLLNKDGLLYLLTNQQLFVPSQEQRTKQLLDDVKLEAAFDFSELKGRGEIPTHLYIFSKKNLINSIRTIQGNDVGQLNKNTFLSFRLTGALTIFNRFQKFPQALQGIIHNKKTVTTPILQSDLGDGLSIEYHYDAVVNGKLLNSHNNNPASITHPNFFKNLTRASLPLDSFFQIESIDPTKTKSAANELLGIDYSIEQAFPLILIVNFSNNSNIELEISPSYALRAKFEQCGLACYRYFGLIPKIERLNLNLFREYFSTDIGRQIIRLSIDSSPSKLKAKIKTLLIPKFFGKILDVPNHILTNLSPLLLSQDDLLKIHPEQFCLSIKNALDKIHSSIQAYPNHTLGIISAFKLNLQNVLEKFEKLDAIQLVNFENPLIIESILKLPTRNIIPNNPDIFVEIANSSPAFIHGDLINIATFNSNNDHGIKLFTSNDNLVATLYGDATMVCFISHILASAQNLPISTILQNLQIPQTSELKVAIEKVFELKSSLTKAFELSRKTIAEIITQELAKN